MSAGHAAPQPSPRRVLIVQTAFLGDVILTLPLVQALRDALSGSQIFALVIPAAAEVLRHHPSVDVCLVYDKRGTDGGLMGLARMAQRLRRRDFDLAMVPHRSMRSALLVTLARIPRRIGFSSSAGSFLFTDTTPRRGEIHEVERNLDLLRAMGIPVKAQPPRIYPREKDRQLAKEFLTRQGIDLGRRLIGVAPGSVWPTKRWLSEGFSKVIRDLREGWDMAVVLLGGSEDVKLCREIASKSGAEVLVAAGELSILSAAAMMERCQAVLSNDSAAAHLAAAVGRPVVAIFGPTVPRFGFVPYGPQHVVVQADVGCRPCGVHGGRRCPRANFACMREITPEQVREAVEVVLKREARSTS